MGSILVLCYMENLGMCLVHTHTYTRAQRERHTEKHKNTLSYGIGTVCTNVHPFFSFKRAMPLYLLTLYMGYNKVM